VNTTRSNKQNSNQWGHTHTHTHTSEQRGKVPDRIATSVPLKNTPFSEKDGDRLVLLPVRDLEVARVSIVGRRQQVAVITVSGLLRKLVPHFILDPLFQILWRASRQRRSKIEPGEDSTTTTTPKSKLCRVQLGKVNQRRKPARSFRRF
jgi:hypothetical protein